jgi:tRNA1(Val) A37 N6-methylase TrmN6
MQIVHSHREEPGKLALVQSTKGGNRELKVLEPLVVYRQGDSYTHQMQKIYEDLEPRSSKLT